MKQRLIRVLVYEGSPEWVQECLKTRAIKDSYNGKTGVIKEAIVGDFLEEVTTRQVIGTSVPPLLVQAHIFGHFADDYDQPLAKSIRKELRDMLDAANKELS